MLLGAAPALAPLAALAGGEVPRVASVFEAGRQRFDVTLPRGYALERVSGDLEAPRMLGFARDGVLYAGSRSGNVYRLRPPYGRVEVVARLRGYPHSVVVRGDELLVALTDGVYRAAYDGVASGLTDEDFTLWVALPGGGGHNSRTLREGPDGRLYVSLGIRGNCSDEYLGDAYPPDRRRGGVYRIDESGREPRLRPYASGLRNPVGFDWHPATGIMYASNNGPDHQGFEQPPEVFAALEDGSFHGMPWFQFDGVAFRRDDCISSEPPRPVSEARAPVATFPARNAPMAVAFVPPGALDARFDGDAVVALRGSWGTAPSGSASGDPASRRAPALVRVRFDGGRIIGVEDLVTGFQLADGRRWARPVGVAVGPDGALYFTSDTALEGLYRLRRLEP